MLSIKSKYTIDLLTIKPNTNTIYNLYQYYNKIYFLQKNTNKDKLAQHSLLMKSIRKIKNLIFVPIESNVMFIPSLDIQLQSQIQNIVQYHQYNAIYIFGSTFFGFYLNNLQHKNVICDVIDSNNLYFFAELKQNLLKNKKLIKPFCDFINLIHNIRWEKKFLKNCQKFITITEKDKHFFSKSIKDKNIYVVPNGVDTDYWSPEWAMPGKTLGLIVFFGVMSYKPNHDAAMYILHKIWPKIQKLVPGVRFRIIGKNPLQGLLEEARHFKEVEVTGTVPDIREAVRGACVFLCPMRLGSGMKNKILESMAMGIPVVVNPNAAEGIDMTNGKEGYISDDPDMLAEFAAKLAVRQGAWEEKSSNCLKLVRSKYSWSAQGVLLSKILDGDY
ncbi:MAG: glycosyltransferase [Bacillota bacterium]